MGGERLVTRHTGDVSRQAARLGDPPPQLGPGWCEFPDPAIYRSRPRRFRDRFEMSRRSLTAAGRETPGTVVID